MPFLFFSKPCQIMYNLPGPPLHQSAGQDLAFVILDQKKRSRPPTDVPVICRESRRGCVGIICLSNKSRPLTMHTHTQRERVILSATAEMKEGRKVAPRHHRVFTAPPQPSSLPPFKTIKTQQLFIALWSVFVR